MVDTKPEDRPDFFVISEPDKNPSTFFELYENIKKRCTSQFIEARKKPSETHESFLFRIALSSFNDKNALFRRSPSNEDQLASIWVSLVKEKAMRIGLEHRPKFSKNFGQEALREVAKLSKQPKKLSELPEVLSRHHGIILVTERYIDTSRVDGCSFRLPNGVPVIGISIRYNRYDNFWFTLMHELSHIALHYDQLETPIVDDLESCSNEDIELEANRLAGDSLVPRNIFRKALLEYKHEKSLLKFSDQADVHPSILAGMLRHKTGKWALYSNYVNFFNVRSEFENND